MDEQPLDLVSSSSPDESHNERDKEREPTECLESSVDDSIPRNAAGEIDWEQITANDKTMVNKLFSDIKNITIHGVPPQGEAGNPPVKNDSEQATSLEDLVKDVDVDKMFSVLTNILPKKIEPERTEIHRSFFCKGDGLFMKEVIAGAEIVMIEDPIAYVNLVEGSAAFCKEDPFLSAIDAPNFFGELEYSVPAKRIELPAAIQLMLSVLDQMPDTKTDTVRGWCRGFASEELERLEMYRDMNKIALKACTAEFPNLNHKTVTMLFRTVHCNSFLAKSPLMVDVIYGTGIWKRATKINHSCDPNCIEVIAHGRLYIVAVRDMIAGSEITLDYNKHYGSSVFASMYRIQQTTAQKNTRDNGIFGFICSCEKCKRAASSEGGKPALDRLSEIAVTKLGLIGEDLRKWNANLSLMYTSFYQLAKMYEPSTYRTLDQDEAAPLRQLIVSILKDASKLLSATKMNNPIELLGVHPFSTLVKMILMELQIRGVGKEFNPAILKNAKAIASYLLKNQRTNLNLEEIETAMISTALRVLITGYDKSSALTQLTIREFSEAFLFNLSTLFWTPFVFPMLAMKEGHLSYGAHLGVVSLSLANDLKIEVFETVKKT